jgi:hypothetical protein
MNKRRIWVTLSCCLFTVALFAWAQSARKAGLWEVTTTMNMAGMQMPQMPPNMQMPAGMRMPSAGGGSPFGTHTSQVCVSQEMIDKFGGPTGNPPSHNSDCKMTNVSIMANGMTAKMVCTGQLNATGDVKSTWTDGNTTHTTIHLEGTMQHGPNTMPVNMTIQSNSVYKGPDCGSVQPAQLPKD